MFEQDFDEFIAFLREHLPNDVEVSSSGPVLGVTSPRVGFLVFIRRIHVSVRVEKLQQDATIVPK